jgi:thiol-disulfide isomerase/thioredoxin
VKPRTIRNLIVSAPLAIGVLAWFVLPGPFAHGIIVGFLATLGALLGGLVAFTMIAKKRRGTTLKPPPLPTSTWDYAMDLKDLDGAPVRASQWSGTVLVLNFWGTWCAPCVAEMPSLKRLRERTVDLDVRFGFVTREKSAVVRPFVEKWGIDLPIYLLEGEPPECFKTRGIPATFVLDRHGSIVMRHTGAAAWDADSIVGFIRGLAVKPSA